jgi:hypothetical protein
MPPKQRPHGSASKSKSRQRTDQSTNKRLVYLGGAVGVVILSAFFAWLLVGGGTEDAEAKARTALEAAGCELKAAKAVPNVGTHEDFPDPDATSPKWNTDPPTTGPHYGETLIFGAYDEPVQLGRVLHNLEHGGAYILYGKDVSEATVEQLRSFYDDHERGTILAPYPKLGNQVALGAWVVTDEQLAANQRGQGFLATCESFDEKAFAGFMDAFQFRGPERFPADSLLPGGN